MKRRRKGVISATLSTRCLCRAFLYSSCLIGVIKSGLLEAMVKWKMCGKVLY